MASLFQAREVPRIVPSLPPVKRLPADPEVAAGQCGIVVVGAVIVHPLQSLPGHSVNAPYPWPGLWFRDPSL